ncbi:MAG: hypothetical protein IPM54_18435 [Polyangiaceae bacterium]|nr:hypothetical protein [Polyangiaceae bacterium]
MRNFLLVLGVLASVATTSVAFADVPPPDTYGCNMKAAGDACEKDDGSAGTCVTSTCTKLDYSDGSPPGTIEYDCLICTTSASSSSGSGSSTSSSSGGSSEDEGGCSVRNGGMAGAVGAWTLGAAVLLLSRRVRARGRKRNS